MHCLDAIYCVLQRKQLNTTPAMHPFRSTGTTGNRFKLYPIETGNAIKIEPVHTFYRKHRPENWRHRWRQYKSWEWGILVKLIETPGNRWTEASKIRFTAKRCRVIAKKTKSPADNASTGLLFNRTCSQLSKLQQSSGIQTSATTIKH